MRTEQQIEDACLMIVVTLERVTNHVRRSWNNEKNSICREVRSKVFVEPSGMMQRGNGIEGNPVSTSSLCRFSLLMWLIRPLITLMTEPSPPTTTKLIEFQRKAESKATNLFSSRITRRFYRNHPRDQKRFLRPWRCRESLNNETD